MSAASTPAPSGRQSSSRSSFFIPNAILLFAFGWLVAYQIVLLEDNLAATQREIDKRDDTVKKAFHQKAMFFGIGRDVLALSATDSNAESVAKEFKLHEMKVNKPELFNVAPEDDNTAPVTNAAAATPPEAVPAGQAHTPVPPPAPAPVK